mgnify:CR=1 FL=1
MKKRCQIAMAKDKKIYSDLACPPGEFLAEVLRSKGMTRAELAKRMGCTVRAIDEILAGSRPLAPETAILLEGTLAVPAHIWSGLERRFKMPKATNYERPDRSNRT